MFGLQLAGAGATLVTVRELTRARLGAEAEAAADRTRDALIATWRGGGAPALRGAVAAHLERGRVPQSVILLTDVQGRFRAGNIAAWPPTVPQQGATTIEVFRIDRDAPERMRVVATPLPDGERLMTGHVVESELRFARVMEEAMAVAMGIAIALAGLAAWIAARMIEGRLTRTLATARAVAAGDLDRRVALEGGDDAFEALGRAVNAMLDRIAALVAELKVATDALAHDLRSPLTRLRATLERALAAADSEAGRVAVERAMDEGDRLLAMLDTALRIARAEAGLGREHFAETDIALLVRDLAELYGPLAEDRGMALVVEAPETLMLPAHREMLGQGIANLIDNALKYGAGAVTLTAAASAEGALVSVADRGPGIPAERREEALKRFGRLDAARTAGGAGLGLSLAAAVAHLHGGTLALEDDAPGLRATLTVVG